MHFFSQSLLCSTLSWSPSPQLTLLSPPYPQHVSPEECVVALNECEWDVHRALKLIRLQLVIPAHRVPLEAARSTLASFSWDVGKAASYLVATQGINEDTAQV